MSIELLSLLLSLLLGFSSTLIALPFVRRYLKSSGVIGIDQQKENKPKVASSGGVVVLFGFLTAVCFYIGLNSVLQIHGINLELVLAALASVSIISLIGLIDDINVNGENEVLRDGLTQDVKGLLVLPAAFPLIAVGAGSWTMILPFIGRIDWGLIYPLLLLPLGLLFVANVVNMLEGVNGLATGLSTITSASLGVMGYLTGSLEATIIGLVLSSCLLAFFIFNYYPASFLPGDSLTYLCGAGMFAAMVIGNMEKFGVMIFILWLLEFALKIRSRFNARSWGLLQEDGSLKNQHDKIYSVTHIFMKFGFNEKQIVNSIMLIQLVICLFSGYVYFTFMI